MGFDKINAFNFSGVNLAYLFLPYGVILFALTGSSIIPEMEEILRKEHKNLKKSIIIGSLIPVFVYILFATTIVGISGSFTSDDSIAGLSLFLPEWIVFLGATLGILSMGSSFLTLGYVLKEVWHRDFKFPKILSFVLACSPCLILFLLGAKNFINILGIAGAVAGGLTGILILAIFQKSKKQGEKQPIYCFNLPKILIFALLIILFLGIVSPFI